MVGSAVWTGKDVISCYAIAQFRCNLGVWNNIRSHSHNRCIIIHCPSNSTWKPWLHWWFDDAGRFLHMSSPPVIDVIIFQAIVQFRCSLGVGKTISNQLTIVASTTGVHFASRSATFAARWVSSSASFSARFRSSSDAFAARWASSFALEASYYYSLHFTSRKSYFRTMAGETE